MKTDAPTDEMGAGGKQLNLKIGGMGGGGGGDGGGIIEAKS